MKKQKRKHHKGAALAPRLRIKTTVDFGEEGIPLERFDEVMQALKEVRLDLGLESQPRIRAHLVRPLRESALEEQPHG